MRITVSRFRNPVSTLLVLGMLNGCQTASGLPTSHAMAELSPQASDAIAHDMIARLTEHVPAGSRVQLRRDGSRFAAALEASLTDVGYAVAPADTKDAGSVQIAYVIEPFDGQILARLATRTVDLGRTYTLTESGASPASPLSVQQRG